MSRHCDHHIVIFGAGGHAKVVHEIASLKRVRVRAFVDLRSPERAGDRLMNTPILGSWETAVALLDDKTRPVVAIGDNRARGCLQRRLEWTGHVPLTMVHPEALVSTSAVVEEGVVIGPRAIVNAAAHIGAGAIVNSMSLVEHDCVIGRFAHIAPTAALAGSVVVGARSFVGLGARVRDRCKIGEDAVIGVGSVVVRDVGDGVVACGVPARPMRHVRVA